MEYFLKSTKRSDERERESEEAYTWDYVEDEPMEHVCGLLIVHMVPLL
jgi:hypothetical protein